MLFIQRRTSCLLLLLTISVTQALYSKYDSVIQLDPQSFRQQVVEGKGVWFVEFYAPWCGHCKSLAPEWKKAAKALEGIVNVAAVDADQHKSLAGQYGIRGFPTIKVFGDDKSKPTDYQGQRDAKNIVDAGLSEAKKLAKSRLNGKQEKKAKKPSSSSSSSDKAKTKGDVVVLTDDNFDDLVLNSDDLWMVEFYAPWCGHCKALAPEWEQAASELKGNVKVGAIDATEHKNKGSEYGIQGFPTIKVFGPGATSSKDAEDYQGQRTASSIVTYALNKLEKSGGGIKLPELHKQDVFENHCAGNSICVVSFLPHILDTAKSGREKYLEELNESAKLVRGKPFRFAWIQGGDQLELEKVFGLTFGFPAIVAINLNKKRYAVQKTSFSKDSIKIFLDGLMSGSEETVEYESLPKLKTVQVWDGQDVSFPEEEEVDEDIMNEILGSTGKDDL